jgi:hypothetical protein
MFIISNNRVFPPTHFIKDFNLKLLFFISMFYFLSLNLSILIFENK